MHLDGSLLQVPQRIRVDVQLLIHAEGQDHDGRAVVKQLFNVGDLDTRHVPGPGLGPVPRTPTTGVQLEVLPDTETRHLHPAPGNIEDLRRAHDRLLSTRVRRRAAPPYRCTRSSTSWVGAVTRNRSGRASALAT